MDKQEQHRAQKDEVVIPAQTENDPRQKNLHGTTDGQHKSKPSGIPFMSARVIAQAPHDPRRGRRVRHAVRAELHHTAPYPRPDIHTGSSCVETQKSTQCAVSRLSKTPGTFKYSALNNLVLMAGPKLRPAPTLYNLTTLVPAPQTALHYP